MDHEIKTQFEKQAAALTQATFDIGVLLGNHAAKVKELSERVAAMELAYTTLLGHQALWNKCTLPQRIGMLWRLFKS